MKILVIGDSCLDVFVYGNCDRLSPEAPIPVFIPQETVTERGMAWNVKRNLDSIGTECDIFTNELTITKTRYVESKTNHMLLRIDENDRSETRANIQELLKIIDQYDAVVIADYNKGFLSENDIEIISNHHKLTFLDTKKKIGSWAENITFVKINSVEFEYTKDSISDELLKRTIVTMGEQGCKIQDSLFPVSTKIPVIDVVGAGDAFMAGFVSQYLKTNNIENSIEFAQECAMTVVQKRGVATV